MDSRRTLLKTTAVAMAGMAARSALGANEQIRMGIIGAGTRGGRVFDSLARHADCRFLAVAEVNDAKLATWMTPARQTWGLQRQDYRKILDRKDIDAVLITTPDHAHSQIMVDAVAAGKDVYVEKPVSNSVPRVNAMLDAYNRSKQIVQVGTHQRSWDHFIEAKKIVDGGTLGTISHVMIVQPGSYSRPKEAEQPVPAGLDWAGWQGDAPVRPFKPSRLNFRAWYAYGSGMVGDWGAHHVDVGMWFMNADGQAPLVTMANSARFLAPDADSEQVPDTFAISWKFEKFMMTFSNAEAFRTDEIESWGVFFIGTRGSLQINRQGWAIRPVATHVNNKVPPPLSPTLGGVAVGLPVAAAPARPAGTPLPALDANMYINPRGGVEEDYPLNVHTRNFLDCVRSRQKPAAPMEIGYSSAVPCLIALEAMQLQRPLGWDAVKRTTRAL